MALAGERKRIACADREAPPSDRDIKTNGARISRSA